MGGGTAGKERALARGMLNPPLPSPPLLGVLLVIRLLYLFFQKAALMFIVSALLYLLMWQVGINFFFSKVSSYEKRSLDRKLSKLSASHTPFQLLNSPWLLQLSASVRASWALSTGRTQAQLMNTSLPLWHDPRLLFSQNPAEWDRPPLCTCSSLCKPCSSSYHTLSLDCNGLFADLSSQQRPWLLEAWHNSFLLFFVSLVPCGICHIVGAEECFNDFINDTALFHMHS